MSGLAALLSALAVSTSGSCVPGAQPPPTAGATGWAGVVIGAPGRSHGRYYVNQRLVPPTPDRAYGPAALGISAFSPVLTNWPEGGPIGIHGTNEAWSIGRSGSHGCIRLPNSVDRRVFAQTPPGDAGDHHPLTTGADGRRLPALRRRSSGRPSSRSTGGSSGTTTPMSRCSARP